MAKRPKHGFQEHVKNPDLFRAESTEIERTNTALPPTTSELAGLVSAMGKRRLNYRELQQLRNARDQVAPLLLTALQDERFLFHRYGECRLDGSAIETALDLLEPFALPEVRMLEPALRHPDDFFCYHALYHLARCGSDDAIDALEAGLKSSSVDCRTFTLIGLQFLKDSPRGSRTFRTALFKASLPTLLDKDHRPAEQSPRALLALDFRGATSVLLGEDIFRPDNKYIYWVLKALKDANVAVPAPQLRKLLAGIKTKAADHPFNYAYADGLILLARADGSRAKDLISDAQAWGNDKVKEGAARALAVTQGVNDAYGFVSDLYRRKGAKGLNETQFYYLTLWWLDADVRNGGFSQYYFNTRGELATHAVKAARSVGAPEIAAIIAKANSLFGKNGPPADRDKRMDQLSKIDLEALEELNTRYYRCPERLSEILPRFVASHPESFKNTP